MRILAIIAVLLLPGRAALAADPLAELIATVEQAESHYSRLKLELTSTYRIAEDVEVGLDPNFQEHLQNDTQMSIVLANAQFRVETTTRSHTLLEVGLTEASHLFDGRIHRSYWKHSSAAAATGVQQSTDSGGLVSDEHPSLTNLARPHMLLLEAGCPQVPLSTYLKGHEAVLAHPNPSYFPGDTQIVLRDLGAADFAGLHCRRILIDSYVRDVLYNGWELWLAEERNFIPARNVAYTYRDSKDMPVADSAVDEWQELRPGIWFPKMAHTDRYDSFVVSNKGEKRLSWRTEYEVRSVTLEPETTPATFTELEFPPGTKVRVIENGVEVTK